MLNGAFLIERDSGTVFWMLINVYWIYLYSLSSEERIKCVLVF